jgi:hypothetical protein
MPNRLVRDANGNLNPKNTVGGYVDGTVVNADVADSSIRAGKLDYFLSGEITGTAGALQTAHGLGRVPALVLVIPTEDTGVAGTLSIVEGSHDATDVIVTAPATLKFKIFAI